jgi:hypothetical protein
LEEEDAEMENQAEERKSHCRRAKNTRQQPSAAAGRRLEQSMCDVGSTGVHSAGDTGDVLPRV